MSDHYLYFIQSGEAVKIGVCAVGRLAARLEELQTGNPVDLGFLGWVRCDREEEAQVHRALDHLRVRGEWFRLTPELRRAIHALEKREIERELRRMSDDRVGRSRDGTAATADGRA